MSKRSRAAEPVPVIVLLGSSDEEVEDEPGTEVHAHARPEAAVHKGRSNTRQTPSKPRASKQVAPNAQQKPPLRQQLTFTVSQTPPSQPSPVPVPSSPPQQQQPTQQAGRQPKRQQQASQPQRQQKRQPPPLLVLSSDSDKDDDPLWSNSKAAPRKQAAVGSQAQDRKHSPLLKALLSQKLTQKPGPAVQQALAAKPQASHAAASQLTAQAHVGELPGNAGTAAAAAAAAATLWAEKHMPQNSEDLRLSMHPKKVQQIRDWLEHQLPINYRSEYCRLMIITGPPGCCKSSVVRVLADELCFDIVEWTAPTPTMWSEYKYQASAGSNVPYTSKLDDFETFVSRAKYPALNLHKTSAPSPANMHSVTGSSAQRPAAASSQPSTSQAWSQAPATQPLAAACTSAPGGGPRQRLTLIDDVPYAADLDSRKRLSGALRDLVTTARSPVVLVATEGASSFNSGDNSASGGVKGLHKDILADLQSVGAILTTFNPITAANIVKVLQNVAQKEQVPLSAAAAASIAAAADGDLRNAVQTLQMLYGQKVPALQEAQQPTGKRRRGATGTSKRAAAALQRAINAAPLAQGELLSIAQAQRDQGLQLFHALGKILYNKRDQAAEEEEEEAGWGPDGEVVYNASTQYVHGRSVGSSGGKARGKSAAALAREEAAIKVREERQRADAPGAWLAVVGELAAEVQLPPSCQRPPMRYDPEALLVQSQLDALGAASFLQENYLSFIADDAIEDVAEAAAYLSDAAALATARVVSSGQAGGFGGVNGLEEGTGGSGGGNGGVMQACAGSVATRGLLYANCHPAPRRFLSMRAPAMGPAARACATNEVSLQAFARRLALQQGSAPAGSSTTVLAAQQLPQLRKLTTFPAYHWLLRVMPSEWSYLWEGKVSVVQQQNCGPGAGMARHGRGAGVVQAVGAEPQTQALLSSFVEGLSLEADSQEAQQPVEEEDPIDEVA